METQYLRKRRDESSSLASRVKFVIAIFIALVLTIVFVQYVQAQTAVTLLSDALPAPAVVEIDSSGNALIRGTVEAVDANSLTVFSWGGEWTVLVGGNAVIFADGTTSVAGEMSDISVGDFVGVEGVMASDRPVTLYAGLVRNWTTDPFPGAFTDRTAANTAAESSGVSAATNTNTQTAPANTGMTDTAVTTPSTNATAATTSNDETITYSGEVTAISDTSLTFTDDLDSTYTVNLTADVRLVNDDDELITADDIEVGDEIELDGTAANGTITTSLIRNTSDDGGFF